MRGGDHLPAPKPRPGRRPIEIPQTNLKPTPQNRAPPPEFMATIHDGGRPTSPPGGKKGAAPAGPTRVLYVKGAPDRLLPMCKGEAGWVGGDRRVLPESGVKGGVGFGVADGTGGTGYAVLAGPSTADQTLIQQMAPPRPQTPAAALPTDPRPRPTQRPALGRRPRALRRHRARRAGAAGRQVLADGPGGAEQPGPARAGALQAGGWGGPFVCSRRATPQPQPNRHTITFAKFARPPLLEN